ncbi:MAG TPA: DNA polymerase III subunit beta [Candidatus Paceibacterota bacterium]|nr:DNA polymerase III subunit beta [Candidatus Paceibacterota bacterium]
MKVIIRKEKILSAVVLAERITGKKESLPILSCVLIEAGADLSVRATNLESGIEIKIPCETEEKGVVAIPSQVFSQTLKSISSDKITIGTESGNMLVEARETKTIIKAVPHDEFPKLSGEDKGKGVSMPREQLLRGVRAVSYAASVSMIRPELGSVYISIKKDGLVCAATDSFRLAEKRVRGSFHDGGEILIPLKHAGELIYVLERVSDENVILHAADSQLTMESESVRFVSRVADGIFPDYQEIIPKNFVTEATVLKNDFAEMLRKARVFGGNDQHVGIHIYPKRKIFTATAQSPDVGEMSDSIDSAVSGEDIDINFHIGYLSDCIGSIDSDSITLGFGGVGRPLVIRGVSDQSFTYLAMPLNR